MPVYVAPVVGSAVGANKYHLGLFNGAQSLWLAEVLSVELSSHLTSAVAGTGLGVGTTFVLKRTTGPGTGTAVVFRKHRVSFPAVPPPIAALSNVSTPVEASDPELASQSLYLDDTGPQNPPTWMFRCDREVEPIFLCPGQGIVVQQTGLAALGAVSIFVRFRFRRQR